MNHASTTSDGARHIDAFIDALARRHQRLARLTLLTRAALVVALIWVAAFGVWFLVARESTAAQTLLVAAALVGHGRRCGAGVAAARPAADAGTSGAAGRRPPVGPRRSARHGGGRARTAVAGRRWTPHAAAARRHRAARGRRRHRVGGAVGRRCAARRTGPRPRSARSPCSHLSRASRWAAPAARSRLWAFPERLALEVSPGDARVPPGVAFTVRATTSEAARGLVPDITVRMQDATRTARMKAQPDGAFAFGFESVPRSFAYQVKRRRPCLARIPRDLARAATHRPHRPVVRLPGVLGHGATHGIRRRRHLRARRLARDDARDAENDDRAGGHGGDRVARRTGSAPGRRRRRSSSASCRSTTTPRIACACATPMAWKTPRTPSTSSAGSTTGRPTSASSVRPATSASRRSKR